MTPDGLRSHACVDLTRNQGEGKRLSISLAESDLTSRTGVAFGQASASLLRLSQHVVAALDLFVVYPG